MPIACNLTLIWNYKFYSRMVVERDQDFLMSGQRHPFLTKYKVGVDKNGYIQALDVDMYCNAGYSLDLSFSVLHR